MNNSLREEIHQLHAHICSGLADPIRILILYSLGEQTCSVSELAIQIDIPQPTVSRHLKILRERGLVNSQRDGQFVRYELSDPRVIQALNLLRGVMTSHLNDRAQLANSLSSDGTQEDL